MLTREQIVAAKKLKTEEVDVPEWGGKVLVRELTADKAMELGRQVKQDDRQAMIRWVIAGAVSSDTLEPLFQDTDEDRLLLGGMSAAAILRIGNKAIELSGLADDAEKN